MPALGDAVFVDVSGCGALRDLDARGPLETLDVSGTSLASAALSRLKRPERLRALRCASSDVADGALARLLPTCAALEALDLSGSDRLTDHGLSSVAACHGLLDLDVSGCPGLSDVGMIVLGASCARLRRLNVADCAGLSGRAFAAVPNSTTGLGGPDQT